MSLFSRPVYTLNPFEKLALKCLTFLKNIVFGIGRFFKKLPFRIWGFLKFMGRSFRDFGINFMEGNISVKLSYLFMGAGNIGAKQYVKGLIYFLIEVFFVIYMVLFGGSAIVGFITLGTVPQSSSGVDEWGNPVTTHGDHSLLMLLYGVITILIIVAFVVLYLSSIKSGIASHKMIEKGQHPQNFVEDMKELLDKKLYKTLFFIPIICIVGFTLVPLIYMILMAFTNYDHNHLPPGALFDWTGLDSFATIFSSGKIGVTFLPVLGWTLIWAVLATVTNFFGGIFVALLINNKGVKGKKIYRMIFVLTIAIPQFITLLTMQNFFHVDGPVNSLLMQWGWIDKRINFLTDISYDALLPRTMVLLINLWIGIPYTMLITTGVLMNVPAELYEAARLDGASPIKLLIKITMPYIMFITGPYLIQQFIGNINNFNVIYLLTSGGPATPDYHVAGKTDLLITWLYKLTIDQNDYNVGAAIGIMTFVVSATFSLLAYNQSASYKKEEDFQ